MQLSKPLRPASRRISLTPLIDIVFILLLFFILESNFLRLGELVFNSPEKQTAGNVRADGIEIQVFSGDRIWLNSRSFDLAGLDGYLATAGYPSQTPVFLRVDKELPVQLMVRVVDLLKAHALSQLQILPLEE
jgi:biopolymer transport protein ExbD